MDYLLDSEIAKKEDRINFKTRDVVDKVKDENFVNSVYLRY